MASDFSVKQALHLNVGGAATVQVDVSRVAMNDEQRAIVSKLLASFKPDDRVSTAEDQCEAGKCIASKYLSNDEFQKVRGLKATLGTDAATEGIIADFCLHVVVV